jgi:hypothetical protein
VALQGKSVAAAFRENSSLNMPGGRNSVDAFVNMSSFNHFRFLNATMSKVKGFIYDPHTLESKKRLYRQQMSTVA